MLLLNDALNLLAKKNDALNLIKYETRNQLGDTELPDQLHVHLLHGLEQ
jgi:hypothetical protein